MRIRKLQSDNWVICWGSCKRCGRCRRLFRCDEADVGGSRACSTWFDQRVASSSCHQLPDCWQLLQSPSVLSDSLRECKLMDDDGLQCGAIFTLQTAEASGSRWFSSPVWSIRERLGIRDTVTILSPNQSAEGNTEQWPQPWRVWVSVLILLAYDTICDGRFTCAQNLTRWPALSSAWHRDEK